MYSGGVLLLVSAAAAGFCAGACSAPEGGHGGTRELRPALRPYTADIPLVEGFRLVDKSSEDWASGGVRYVRHKYVGRADPAEVRDFYRAEMPLVRWTALSESMSDGKRRMRFVRGDEECTVVIGKERSGLTRRAAVEVTISPSHASAEGGAPQRDEATGRRVGEDAHAGQKKRPE